MLAERRTEDYVAKTPRPKLLSTAAAATILGVSVAKVLAWIHSGELPYVRTYRNNYGGDSYLLDEATVRAPETRERLAEQIAAFQMRSARGKRAAQARVDKERAGHDDYLVRLEGTAPTPQLRDLFVAAYYLWHLNHWAKANRSERTRLYGLKDRMLAAFWERFAVVPVESSLDGTGAAGALRVELRDTGLDAGESPRPHIEVERVYSEGWYGQPRHYLSLVVEYDAFRFPFHTLWDNARRWLPPQIRALLVAKEWDEVDAPFTFGGRAATWVERRAIPLAEVTNALGDLYQRLTGRCRDAFLRQPSQPGHRAGCCPSRDWDDESEKVEVPPAPHPPSAPRPAVPAPGDISIALHWKTASKAQRTSVLVELARHGFAVGKHEPHALRAFGSPAQWPNLRRLLDCWQSRELLAWSEASGLTEDKSVTREHEAH